MMSPYFLSVEELVNSGIAIDMASVCTAGKENGGDHYEPTMGLLHAGIPVLGEKPISNELPKARKWWPWPRPGICATASI